MARFTQSQLAQIASRRGYGIKSTLGKGTAGRKVGDPGTIDDLERDPQHALQGEKSLQIACSGRPLVRITFYRYRLADHSRSISEKALVDALQYAGAICGDSERDIRLVVEDQVKVGSKIEERTEVTIEYPEVNFDQLFAATGRTDGR